MRRVGVKDSPQLSCLKRSVILGCFPPQDDATVKCWGYNGGANANGPCPPSSTTASLGLATFVLTLAPALAEMGTNLPSIDLGPGRTAVAVSAGARHTCALLVRLPTLKEICSLGPAEGGNGPCTPRVTRCRSSAPQNGPPEAWIYRGPAAGTYVVHSFGNGMG